MATDVERSHSVPEVAQRWGCNNDKVYAHIRVGNLRAVNTALGDERPRWRILHSDLETFEQVRENPQWNASPKPKRQRPRTQSIEYFP